MSSPSPLGRLAALRPALCLLLQVGFLLGSYLVLLHFADHLQKWGITGFSWDGFKALSLICLPYFFVFLLLASPRAWLSWTFASLFALAVAAGFVILFREHIVSVFTDTSLWGARPFVTTPK